MERDTSVVTLRQDVAYSRYYAVKHAKFALLSKDREDILYHMREAVSWAREALTTEAVLVNLFAVSRAL